MNCDLRLNTSLLANGLIAPEAYFAKSSFGEDAVNCGSSQIYPLAFGPRGAQRYKNARSKAGI
jgi:hypothetical protein